MAKLKLTKTAVAALPVPADKTAVYWDCQTPGLGLRVSPAGRRTYFLQARTRTGRTVKVTLGAAHLVTADQARDAAKKHLAALALGRDPAAELKAKRQSERDRRKAATVAELWADFETNHVASLRPKSQRAYRSWFSNHIGPALGRLKLVDLNRGRVEAMLKATASTAGPSTANRTCNLLSAMLSYGERALDASGGPRFPGVAVNVVRGHKSYPEPGRARELTDAELRRLIAFLDASPAREARVLELALATGARKGELLTMRWRDIAGGWWTVPPERSKSGKRMRKPLSAMALGVLARLDRRGEDVFSSVTESRLSIWWLRARRELGLDDLHIHDLRHGAASLALNAGIPLAAVGAMLGHGVNSAAMTARYAHLSDVELARAGDAVAERLRRLRPAGSA